ncbi:MerR family transcriptional regulator [Cribrihabitans sp. XS_ASV171]
MSKSPDAFRTISEVAEWLGVQAHVLRFWESKFPQVKPVKRAGGRRYYRPNDMLLLGGIKKLLHDDGLTIKGVQKMLREKGANHVAELSQGLDEISEPAYDEGGTVVRFQEKPPAGSAQIDLDFGEVEEATPVEQNDEPQETPRPFGSGDLPSFLKPASPSSEPEAETVATSDRSPVDSEPDPEAGPGPLTALARIDRLSPKDRDRIAPLADALRTWLERYDAEVVG